MSAGVMVDIISVSRFTFVCASDLWVMVGAGIIPLHTSVCHALDAQVEGC